MADESNQPEQTYDEERARKLEDLLRSLASRIIELDAQGRLLSQAGELTRLIGDARASSFTTRSARRTTPRKSPKAAGSFRRRRRPDTDKVEHGTEPSGSRTRTRSRSGEADAVKGRTAQRRSAEELDSDLLSRAGGVAIAGIGALSWMSRRPADRLVGPIDSTLPTVQSDGYVMGSPTAPLEVIEFGDFECPRCGSLRHAHRADVRTPLVRHRDHSVRFIDFPLSMHRNTWHASLAAAAAPTSRGSSGRCTTRSSRRRISGTGSRRATRIRSSKLAGQLKLNQKQFDQCVDTKKYQAKIQAHEQLAEQQRIAATPSFIIGGKIVEGPRAYDEFKSLIDEALAEVGIARRDAGRCGAWSAAGSRTRQDEQGPARPALDAEARVSRRMLMALIALIGVFVSVYLTLYKLGYIGTLVCGTGGCETVQLSRWGNFLGVPVADGGSSTTGWCWGSRWRAFRSDTPPRVA